ncbi:MAG: DUF481 domain-containing protein [Pirellulales bacterium]
MDTSAAGKSPAGVATTASDASAATSPSAASPLTVLPATDPLALDLIGVGSATSRPGSLVPPAHRFATIASPLVGVDESADLLAGYNTLPPPLADLPAGIDRLPALGNLMSPAAGSPTPADPGGGASSEELPTPDGTGAEDGTAAEIVTGEVVEEALVEAETVETYGWGYLGMWLNDRLIPHRVEAGGTYSTGTRNSWSALISSQWKVQEERYDDELTFNGNYTEVDHERSNNEWIASDTFEWKRTDGSPWRMFIKSRAEYDEIEKLSFRGTFSTGLGYAWLNDDDRRLITRAGPSYTYERYFDPLNTNDKPEFLGELEMRFKVFDSMVLEHKTSAYPAFNEDDGVRVNDETGLLTPVGSSPFWSWKLGFRHQYNNKPNTDVNRNQYQASLMLVYDR